MYSDAQAQSLRMLDVTWDLDMDERSIADSASSGKFIRISLLASLLYASKRFTRKKDADHLVIAYIQHYLPSVNLPRVDEDLVIISILDEALQQNAITIIERVRRMDKVRQEQEVTS